MSHVIFFTPEVFDLANSTGFTSRCLCRFPLKIFRGKWKVLFREKGKRITVGRFDNLEEAANALAKVKSCAISCESTPI